MSEEAIRSYDLSKINTEKGFIETLFRLFDVKRMGAIPAIVKAFNRGSNIATVVPLVKWVYNTDTGKDSSDRPECTVPVLQICRGGFMIDAPLFAGDTGILFAIDRAWSGAREKNCTRLDEEQQEDGEQRNKGPVVPDNGILQSFENGFFLPMAFGSSELGDSRALVVRRLKDGDSFIFDEEGIKHEGEGGEEMQIVTDVVLKEETLSKKVRKCKKFGNIITDVEDESGWI